MQHNLTPYKFIPSTDSLRSLLQGLTVFIDTITFYLHPDLQPDVDTQELDRIKQINPHCLDQLFENGSNHPHENALKAKLPHVHKTACDIIRPNDLYHTMAQLGNISDADLQRLNVTYTEYYLKHERELEDIYVRFSREHQRMHDTPKTTALSSTFMHALTIGTIIIAMQEVMARNKMSATQIEFASTIALLAFAFFATETLAPLTAILLFNKIIQPYKKISHNPLLKHAISFGIFASFDTASLSMSGILHYVSAIVGAATGAALARIGTMTFFPATAKLDTPNLERDAAVDARTSATLFPTIPAKTDTSRADPAAVTTKKEAKPASRSEGMCGFEKGFLRGKRI